MASTWGMDGRQLMKYGKALKDFGGKQYPIINGMALNRTAFEAWKEYVRIVERRFTLRNKGTVRSIQFRKVKGLNPNTQESSVGSTMDYMAAQEFGDVKKSKGSKGIAIPTTTASNESLSARPRKKPISRPRRRSSIRLTKTGVRSRSRKQHVFATIRAVAEKGSGNYAYLPIQRAPGIYRVTGKGKKAKIKMVYSLSKKTLPIKKAPSLAPAVNNIIPKMPRYYKEAAEKRLKTAFRF
jgi:hypothetical protein